MNIFESRITKASILGSGVVAVFIFLVLPLYVGLMVRNAFDYVEFSQKAFDFSRENDLDPHLRFLGRFHVTDNLFLLGGYDDFLVDENESIFFGAGLRWSDDDLKYLLGSVPSGF